LLSAEALPRTPLGNLSLQLYLIGLLIKDGGEGREEGKVKGMEGERRQREGFGPPKYFGIALPMR